MLPRLLPGIGRTVALSINGNHASYILSSSASLVTLYLTAAANVIYWSMDVLNSEQRVNVECGGRIGPGPRGNLGEIRRSAFAASGSESGLFHCAARPRRRLTLSSPASMASTNAGKDGRPARRFTTDTPSGPTSASASIRNGAAGLGGGTPAFERTALLAGPSPDGRSYVEPDDGEWRVHGSSAENID
jgi:hypothetical protein